MEHENQIFHGNARIYLQGKGALQLVDKSNSHCYTYFIGSVESAIMVKDFRQEPIQAARAIIDGEFGREFADVFNQPAELKIVGCEDSIEIEMRAGDAVETSPILWIGVIDNKKMPVHRTTWEFLNAIHGEIVAFAALVKA